MSTNESDRRDMPPSPIVPCAPVAWILAAGRGMRMGICAKAAIRIHGRSVLEALIAALFGGGCRQVNVLVGTYADMLRPLALQAGAKVHDVSNPDGTLLDTQADAIRLHLGDHAGSDMLITVADLPLLQARHVNDLLSVWGESLRQGALAPLVKAQRGHPVILSGPLVQRVSAEGHGRVRTWFERHPQDLATWNVLDPAYVTDLDTPEDLATVSRWLRPSPN